MHSRFPRLRLLTVSAMLGAALLTGCEDAEPSTTIEGEEEQPVPGEPGAPDPIGPEGVGDDPTAEDGGG